MFKSVRERPAALYELLIEAHVQSGDVFLTFNYDLALERALRKKLLWEINDGYGFSLGLDDMPSSSVNVLKLHGSTNWWGAAVRGNEGIFSSRAQRIS